MIPAGIAARPLQRGEGGGGDDRRARAVSGWASESGRCASRGGVGRSGSNAGAVLERGRGPQRWVSVGVS